MISKVLKRMTNSLDLPQTQQLKQATNIQDEDITKSIHLPYVHGAYI